MATCFRNISVGQGSMEETDVQIMMGIHGNGLTHLLWMNAQNFHSTVIEFFFPGGFAEDYEFTARALGIKHFGIWDDTPFTYPDLPQIKYPEGFQGNEIPLSKPSPSYTTRCAILT